MSSKLLQAFDSSQDTFSLRLESFHFQNIHDARFELTDVEFGRRAGSRERRGREAERLEPSDGFVEEEEKETV